MTEDAESVLELGCDTCTYLAVACSAILPLPGATRWFCRAPPSTASAAEGKQLQVPRSPAQASL